MGFSVREAERIKKKNVDRDDITHTFISLAPNQRNTAKTFYCVCVPTFRRSIIQHTSDSWRTKYTCSLFLFDSAWLCVCSMRRAQILFFFFFFLSQLCIKPAAQRRAPWMRHARGDTCEWATCFAIIQRVENQRVCPRCLNLDFKASCMWTISWAWSLFRENSVSLFDKKKQNKKNKKNPSISDFTNSTHWITGNHISLLYTLMSSAALSTPIWANGKIFLVAYRL